MKSSLPNGLTTRFIFLCKYLAAIAVPYWPQNNEKRGWCKGNGNYFFVSLRKRSCRLIMDIDAGEALWRNIVGDRALSLDEWASYYTPERFPIIEKEFTSRVFHATRLPDAPPEAHEDKIGIVFQKVPGGRSVPAGILYMHSSGAIHFIYHKNYVEKGLPSIFTALPLSLQPQKVTEQYSRPTHLFSEKTETIHRLIPCFDNLMAQEWRAYTEAYAAGQITQQEYEILTNSPKKIGRLIPNTEVDNIVGRVNRIHNVVSRLLLFGRDTIGAVWFMDIDRDPELVKRSMDRYVYEITKGRATITGAHPKVLGVTCGIRSGIGYFRSTQFDTQRRLAELSQYILKLEQPRSPQVIYEEYLGMLATQALLPDDQVAKCELGILQLEGQPGIPVLAIERFDRSPNGGRVHFEELCSLLGRHSGELRDGKYKDIARYLNPDRKLEGHEYDMAKKFYARVLAQFLLANGDNHLKNFSIYTHNDPVILTPNYDLSPALNENKIGIALMIDGRRLTFDKLNAKLLVVLGIECGISFPDIRKIFKSLEMNLPEAVETIGCAEIKNIYSSRVDPTKCKVRMIDQMHNLWDKKFSDYETAIEEVKDRYLRTGVNRIPNDSRHIIMPEVFPAVWAEELRRTAQSQIKNLS